tara:strand:+ start:271 stop:474 length:204 start_codon:yes stop_codon:yes gene_type:complete
MTIKSYIEEIETQSKKPMKEQINDLKIAGAKLLQAIDKLVLESKTFQVQIKSLDRELNDPQTNNERT